ncbi:MAG: carboxypeptidase-like regulatory domain-containing protein [Myxococcaceae bacterium]|jgi:hypothetical protein|nr:carboxypeptidase-like regulatory domain-containing protein [Myxococcaceae bacterium]
MKRVFAAMAAAVGLAACGGGSTQPTGPQQFEQAQKPVSPRSVIVGRVVDGATQQPLDGVSVKAIGFDNTLTTAADGTFKLENIVAGSSVTFVFEKMGYVRQVSGTSTPASAGNSPLEGGLRTLTLEMFPSTCSVGGFLFLPNGRPASGVTVAADHSGLGEGLVTSQTGMDGAFSLAGLGCRPEGAFHSISVPWFDENGDMQADYEGFSRNLTLYPGQPGRIFLTYSAAGVGNRIVASNIVDGELAPNEDLQFTFALPMLSSSLDQAARNQARLFNTTRTSIAGVGVEVPTELTFMSSTQLRVRPANGSLREGERYRLELRLRNANTSSGTTFNTFSQDIDFQVRPAVVMPYNAVVTGVTVLNANPLSPFGVDKFNFNDTGFLVGWNQVSDAVRYEIFARDRANPNFVFVAGFDAAPTPRQQAPLTLSNNIFDAAPGLSGNQPLAYGNVLTFAVVAVDVYGNRSPLMTAMPVTVRDEIPPTVTSPPTLVPDALGTGGVDAINETSAATTARLRIVYSEPMDVAMANAPTFTSAATNAPTVTWAWDPADANQRTLIMTLTFAANTDGSGSFVIRGGRDASNNAIAQAGDIVGSLGGRRELLQNGNFQSGNACSLMGWNPTNTGSAPAPVTVPNNGALIGSTSPCAALLGSPPGSQPSTGRARITQDVGLPSNPMAGFTLQASARARPLFVVNQAMPGASYAMACRVETVALPAVTLGSLAAAAAGPGTDVTTGGFVGGTSLPLTAAAGTTVRVVCEADNATMFAGNGAFYVDEVSVALVRAGTL